MSIKATNLGKATGYSVPSWRKSLEKRLTQPAHVKRWDIINTKIALALVREKVYDNSPNQHKLPENFSPDLNNLFQAGQEFLPKTYYDVQIGLTRLIRDIRPDDFNWKGRRKMVDQEKLSFEIDELVGFVFALRARQEFYWWVGVYEPQMSESPSVCTSLRGFFDGKLWMPIPDELGANCCSKLLQKTDELKDEKNPDFDPFILMKHCSTQEHIRQMLLNHSVDSLESEHRYMLEITLQALAENV